MGDSTIYVRASMTVVRTALARVPSTARAGGLEAGAIMTRVGMALLGRIRRAFVTKARGGTDEAGDRWQALSPKTIAYSRTRQRGTGGRTKAEKGRASRPSQALSNKQQDRWWAVYRRQLAIYRGDKRHAAAAAWVVLKAEGAQTLLDKYGHRQVEILRDTGLLLNSLSPGVASSERVFQVRPGEVIIGTNRKGARQHHEGIPGRLPQRRLWPEPSRWPDSWWQDMTDQLKQGLLDLTVQTIKEIAGQ